MVSSALLCKIVYLSKHVKKYRYFVQISFYFDLRYFVAISILPQFTRFLRKIFICQIWLAQFFLTNYMSVSQLTILNLSDNVLNLFYVFFV